MKKARVLFHYFRVLGVVSLSAYLWQRFILRRKVIKIKIQGLSNPTFVRNEPCDLAIFTQIFIRGEYDVSIPHEVKKIIDCGANIGLASLYFLTKFPKASIVCVEPEPENFSMLQKNLGWNKNVLLLQKAVWSGKTNLRITGQGRGNAGFIVEECEPNSVSYINAVSMEEILDIHNWESADICKIDIEGSEEVLFFKGRPEWIHQVRTMYIEIHENIKPGLTRRLVSLLSPYFKVQLYGEFHVFTRII